MIIAEYDILKGGFIMYYYGYGGQGMGGQGMGGYGGYGNCCNPYPYNPCCNQNYGGIGGGGVGWFAIILVIFLLLFLCGFARDCR